MFQVGDLVRYDDAELGNDVPGIVLALVFDGGEDTDHLEVQWLDWNDGDIAREHPETLIVVSSIGKGK